MISRLQKIIEYGLYLLVFLLPVQTRWIIRAGELNGNYWEYGSISIYGTDILLIALIALFLLYIHKSDILSSGFRIAYYWWFIAGLELTVFISIFMAPSKLLAVYGYGRFLLGIGLFWLIISANYDRYKMIYSFLGGICLQAGMGLWQFLTQISFACKWLGLAKHDPADLGTSVIETLSGERWLRAYGGLDHPNMLGGLLVVGLLLAIVLFIFESDFTLRTHFQKGVLPAAVCLLTSGIFFTFSRAAWAGLLTVFIVILGISLYRSNRQHQIRLLKITAIMTVIVICLSMLYSDLVLTRLSQDTRLEIKSNSERIGSYLTARDIISDNWIFGVGINNYTLAVYNEISKNEPGWFYQPVHNVFLLILGEIGIIGLILFISLQCFTVCSLYCKRSLTRQQIYFGFPILPALTVMFMIDHWWWSLHFGVLMFWMVCGLIISGSDMKKSSQITVK